MLTNKVSYYSNKKIKIYKKSIHKIPNTFKINVTAQKIFFIKSTNTLIKIWNKCKKFKIPFLILGEGSNTLFLENYLGIIGINKIKGIKIKEKNKNWHLHVNSGENWHYLVQYTIKKGIFGLENLVMIPGSVGSAPINNIGAYGLEIKDICQYVDVLCLQSKKIKRIEKKNCYFGYRDSIFKYKYQSGYIIIAIGIILSKYWKPITSYGLLKKINLINITPYQIFNKIKYIRKNTIPNYKLIGNVGSFFKNPILIKKNISNLLEKYKNIPYYPEKNGRIKLSAAWLIEQCGLKSYTIGGASVYHKQPLILINKKKATSQEILRLAYKIFYSVKKKFNILLELEVQLIGKNGKEKI